MIKNSNPTDFIRSVVALGYWFMELTGLVDNDIDVYNEIEMEEYITK